MPNRSNVCAVDTEQIGFRCAAVLDAMMRGESPPDRPVYVPPVGVVQRQSTATTNTADPEMRLALSYIRERATTGIDVDEVVRAVGLSRRVLEQRFKRHIRRSPAKEIERVRLLEAARLLAQTDLKMPAIASRCGYANAPRLYEAFHRLTGLSLSAYREQCKPFVTTGRTPPLPPSLVA